jgi:P pilus assembly chaperone PapD
MTVPEPVRDFLIELEVKRLDTVTVPELRLIRLGLPPPEAQEITFSLRVGGVPMLTSTLPPGAESASVAAAGLSDWIDDWALSVTTTYQPGPRCAAAAICLRPAHHLTATEAKVRSAWPGVKSRVDSRQSVQYQLRDQIPVLVYRPDESSGQVATAPRRRRVTAYLSANDLVGYRRR